MKSAIELSRWSRWYKLQFPGPRNLWKVTVHLATKDNEQIVIETNIRN